MRFSPARVLLALSLYLGLSPLFSPAGAEQPSETTPAYTLERISKQFTLRSGQKVILSNPWGDIRLGQTGGDQLTFHAVMQKIGDQPKVAQLNSHWQDSSEQVLILDVEYPTTASPASVREGRVDVALLVPYGAEIEVYAERGRVLSKSMESPLTVHALDQAVSLKSRGLLDVRTQSGDISLVFLGGAIEQRGRVQSLSGTIELRYYKDQALAVEMVSGASKTTNDLALLQSEQVEGHRVRMHKGEQAPQIYLQNDTGHIILNNLAAEFEASQEEDL